MRGDSRDDSVLVGGVCFGPRVLMEFEEKGNGRYKRLEKEGRGGYVRDRTESKSE